MQTYCVGCKKQTNNVCPKKLVTMKNRKTRGKSRCADCLANKLFSDKKKHKHELEVFVSQFLID